MIGVFLEKYRVLFSCVLIAVLAIGTIFLLRRNTTSETIQFLTPTAGTNHRPVDLKVYVTGAIKNPGVYTFTEDARVEQALEAAGGPSDNADLSHTNLALKLKDEMQVTIPAILPTAAAPLAVSETNAKLNINSASSPELESLPKIGPVTAKKIIDYRQKNGQFRTTRELVEKKLVPQSTYDALADLIDAR